MTWVKNALSVDTQSELPVAIKVKPANLYVGEKAIPILEQVHKEMEKEIQFVITNAAYDQNEKKSSERSDLVILFYILMST